MSAEQQFIESIQNPYWLALFGLTAKERIGFIMFNRGAFSNGRKGRGKTMQNDMIKLLDMERAAMQSAMNELMALG